MTAVFHGHAHRGSPEGKIDDTLPVYNVALPLLRRRGLEKPPVRVVEVVVGDEMADAPVVPSASA